MDATTIEKVLHKILSPLPQSKALLWPDIQIGFDNLTGESVSDHLGILEKVINELNEKKSFAV